MNRQQRRAAARLFSKENRAPGKASKPHRSTSSLSPRQPEDDARAISLFEQLDGFSPMRNGLRRVAEMKKEWAGIPMPLEDQKLVIHPGYSWAEDLMKMGAKTKPEGEYGDIKFRNHFWSTKLRNEVYIWEEGGKIEWACAPRRTELDLSLQTLGSSDAWGIEQEGRAVQTLGQMLRHRPFKQYLQTGMFLETSARSGLTYLFRRLRPTVVLDARKNGAESTRILCALCLHPIGYYQDSWAGAMCPTDDVIAHLSLMRGDEPLFWRRANQHAPGRPEAAI